NGSVGDPLAEGPIVERGNPGNRGDGLKRGQNEGRQEQVERRNRHVRSRESLGIRTDNRVLRRQLPSGSAVREFGIVPQRSFSPTALQLELPGTLISRNETGARRTVTRSPGCRGPQSWPSTTTQAPSFRTPMV